MKWLNAFVSHFSKLLLNCQEVSLNSALSSMDRDRIFTSVKMTKVKIT